jgi:hypothetical protein
MFQETCNSDNRHFDLCPSRMSDCRFASNHKNDYVFNESLKKENGLKGHNDYRKYLQNNALKLMQRDFESVVSCSCKSNTCVFKHPHVRVMTDTFNSEMSSYNKSVTNKRSALDKALVKNDCGSFKHYRLNNE